MIYIDKRVLQVPGDRSEKSAFYGTEKRRPGASAGFLNIQDPEDLAKIVFKAFAQSPEFMEKFFELAINSGYINK